MPTARRLVLSGLLVALLTACSAPPPPTPVVSSAPASPRPSVSSTGLPRDGRPVTPMPDVLPEGVVDPPSGLGLERYRAQNVDWRPCDSGRLRCATVLAPLDYGDPDGQALTLAVAKRVATGGRRLGSLFVNPGGPGGSGVEFVRGWEAGELTAYDLVGWDPRGVGGSTPVRCANGADLDRYYSIDVSPDDGGELDELIADREAFGASCLERSGLLLRHISTMATVADLDLLRSLVGDEKLHYFGSSYGTRVGALYAEEHPDRVARMVLDGAISFDPNPAITQVEGFERALDHFATWCAGQQCRLGATREAVLATVSDFLGRLDEAPMTGSSKRVLSQQQGTDAIFYALYAGERGWAAIRDAVAVAALDGSPDALLRLADASNRRDQQGNYDQLSAAFPAIRCLDSSADSVRKAQTQLGKAIKAAPVLGRLSGADLQCPLWPVKSAPAQPKVTAEGTPPIVVIGTTGDPATPYEYAPAMAEQLDNGVLVTFRGEGHLAYGQSECVRTLVAAYLIDDVVPADRTTC